MSIAPGTDHFNASEVAQAMVKLVSDRDAFPQQAAEDLARLLGHDLAVTSPGARRQARLGLLIDLVSHGQGQFIASTTYEAARLEQSSSGLEWPTASALCRAYWTLACGSEGRLPLLVRRRATAGCLVPCPC
jgi:hypothetical protein